jgi:putative transposase
MDKKARVAIGLLRHRIISPVLMDTGRAQMEYFREQESKEFEVPGYGRQLFSASTMKGWLHDYRKHGFDGLVPQIRSDLGQFRKIPDHLGQEILKFREDLQDLSISKFYRRCLLKDLLGVPPVSRGTVHRFLKAHGYIQDRVPKPRKRFEMSHFGELWTCDFMHGPMVLEREGGKRKRKAILFAIIDDYSRIIVGARFGIQESTLPIEEVLKEALVKFGLVDRIYCDNGPSFSSQYFAKVCANLGIGLVHSKPYDSPSRGKIERVFRTIREGFLVDIREIVTLKTLNDKFEQWLRDEYHYKHHAGIDCRPIDRYQISISSYPRKRVDLVKLDEFFLVSVFRKVKHDSTASLNGVIYELPSHLMGKKVELRYSQETPAEVYVYEGDKRVHRLKQVDSKENGRLYRPVPKDTVIPFQKIIHNDEHEKDES